MDIPRNLQILLDGDILRYEIGFAAETGWKAVTETDDLPPWDFVENMLLERIATIKNNCFTDKEPIIYLTEGKTFRFDIAKKKPYKGTRVVNKPWHFNNLTTYLNDVLGARVVTGIEADDAMAMYHTASGGNTILVSRDKDLKQVPGWFYSWELGNQPSWGPDFITQEGTLEFSQENKKLKGTGLSWFYAQVLVGDSTDNIPGLPKCGPVKAYELLNGKTSEEQLQAVCQAYREYYPDTSKQLEETEGNIRELNWYDVVWEIELTEQGRLCWLLRKPDEHWYIGKTE